MPELSDELPGIENYVVKQNFRREFDAEERRPGWDFFPGLRLNQGLPITLVGDVEAVDGTHEIVAATATDIFRFDATLRIWTNIGTGYDLNARRWQLVVVNGVAVFNNGSDLPVSWEVGDLTVTPLYELRESGFARVETIENYENFLVCSGMTELNDTTDFMNNFALYVPAGQDAYGRVIDDTVVTAFPNEVVWSDAGDPRRYRLVINGDYANATGIITLDHPTMAFQLGDFINMGAEISNEEITFVNAARTQLTVAAGFTALTDVFVTMHDFAALLSGYNELGGSGNRIINSMVLGDFLVVYSEQGVWIGTVTGQQQEPLVFDRQYTGSNALFYQDAIGNVEDEYHLFAGKQRFWTFDLVKKRPVYHKKLNFVQKEYFPEADQTVHIVENDLDKEIWLCLPEESNKTIVYDSEQDTVDTIDATFSAGSSVKNPFVLIADDDTDIWFVLGGFDGQVYLYKHDEDGADVYHRKGLDYSSVLQMGLGSFGDDFYAKNLNSYTLLYQDESEDVTVQVEFLRSINPKAVPDVAATTTVTKDHNYKPTHFRGIYWSVRLTITGQGNPASIIGQIFGVSQTRSKPLGRL